MAEPDPYETFRADMRRRHGYCGPYRLGIAIGEAGSDLDAPEYYSARSVDAFEDGLIVGAERLARAETERDIRIAIWNACKSGGMGDDLSRALLRRAMNEPTMLRVIQRIG